MGIGFKTSAVLDAISPLHSADDVMILQVLLMYVGRTESHEQQFFVK